MKASKIKLFFCRKRIDDEEKLDVLKIRSGLKEGEAENKFEPKDGMICYVKDEDKDYQFNGEEWVEVNKKKFFIIWALLICGIIALLLLAIVLPIALSNKGGSETSSSEPTTSESTSSEETSQDTSEETSLDPIQENYTVTFNAQGGSEVATQTIHSGNKATAPADPSNGDLLFGGWYLLEKATVESYFDFNSEITSDITLYAQWVQPYVYTLQSDDGEGPDYYEVGDNEEYRVQDVVIPGVFKGLNVTDIEYSFCENNDVIKTLVIEEGVQRINYNSFSGCPHLTSVTFPEGLKRIEEDSFYEYQGSSIHFPASIRSIGPGAFRYCNNLTELTFEETCDSLEIDENNFESDELRSVVFPEGLKRIGGNCFNTTGLETVFIPSTLELVESDSFNSTNLAKVYSKVHKMDISFESVDNSLYEATWYMYAENGQIPEGLNGNYWYYDGDQIVEVLIDTYPVVITLDSRGGTPVSALNLNYGDEINFPATTKEGYKLDGWYVDSEEGNGNYIANGSLAENSTSLHACWYDENVQITFDAGYRMYFVSGFEENTTKATIPTYYQGKSITIKYGAFQDCATIKGVTIDGDMDSIGNYAFKNCTNLEYLVLEGKVGYIYIDVFSNCPNLSKVYTKVEQTTRVFSGNASYENATFFNYTENGDAETREGNWWYYDASHNIVEVINA